MSGSLAPERLDGLCSHLAYKCIGGFLGRLSHHPLCAVWCLGGEAYGKHVGAFHGNLIVDAPWYVSNATLHSDLGISYVQDVIHQKCNKHHTTLAP
jgi:hypothetical protein